MTDWILFSTTTTGKEDFSHLFVKGERVKVGSYNIEAKKQLHNNIIEANFDWGTFDFVGINVDPIYLYFFLVNTKLYITAQKP